jgi:Glycosyltransferase family 87/WD40-like Beta Propeller Repeat
MLLFVRQGWIPAWRTLNTDFPNYFLGAKLWRAGYPLDRIYDWIWFQRQKDHAGLTHPQVAYLPLTPFSALVVAPLTSLTALDAKRVWLVLNLPLLAATAWLLQRTTALPWRRIFLLVFLAIVPLRTSFLFGQQHLLVLFLLAFATCSYLEDRPVSAGVAAALAAALKLYPALWLFYFWRKRAWRAAGAFVLTGVVLAAIGLSLFGVETWRSYLTEILPRSLKGETGDPYLPQLNTSAALLRRLFIADPALNPHPLIVAPGLYLFLQPLVQAALFAFGLRLVSPRRLDPTREKLEWAGFAALPFILSAGAATYHFVVLILPAALAIAVLVETGRHRDARLLWVCFALCCFPYYKYVPSAPAGWRILLGFPRLYATAAFWGVLAAALWRGRPLPGRSARLSILFVALTINGIVSTRWHLRSGAAGEPLSSATPTLIATAPALTDDRAFFSRLYEGGFTLGRVEPVLPALLPPGVDLFHPTFAAGHGDGWVEIASTMSRVARFSPELAVATPDALTVEIDDAENPVASADGRWIAFLREERGRAGLWIWDTRAKAARQILAPAQNVLEVAFFPDDPNVRIIVAARPSGRPRLFTVDAASGRLLPLPAAADRPARFPAVSPDGRWLAYAEEDGGGWQLTLLDLATGVRHRLTDADCNAVAPAWQSDSRTLVYASDCGRGVGQTALYRVKAVQ